MQLQSRCDIADPVPAERETGFLPEHSSKSLLFSAQSNSQNSN
jgi:hypothetical protein